MKRIFPDKDLPGREDDTPKHSKENSQESAPIKLTLFGHGWYDPEKKIHAPANMVLYGPYGSTLTRAVSKWVREKAQLLTSADIKFISNDAFDQVKQEFGAGPTFDQELWKAAFSDHEYPKHIKKGDSLDQLLLEPEHDEKVPETEDVIQVKKRTPLEQIEAAHRDNVVLHWGACLQQLDAKIKGTDLTVILKPELSNQVFAITRTEMKAEEAHAALRRNAQALEQQLSSKIPDRTTTDEKATLEKELGPELVKKVNSDAYRLPAGEITEEQATSLRALAKEHNVLPGKLLRYVKTFVKQQK